MYFLCTQPVLLYFEAHVWLQSKHNEIRRGEESEKHTGVNKSSLATAVIMSFKRH